MNSLAGKSELHLGFVFPDRGEEIYVSIANGVLTHRPHRAPEKLDGKITVNRMDFLLASAEHAPCP